MAELKHAVYEWIRLRLLQSGLPQNPLTASRGLVTNSAGAVAASTVTTTQLQYLAGLSDITSLNIPQFDGTNLVSRPPIGAETSTTINSGAANDTTIGANTAKFTMMQLPTTAAFFQITGIEWKNGGTINGTTQSYVFRVDASPPVLGPAGTVAYSQAAQSGASSVQRIGPTSMFSVLVEGGAFLAAGILTASASGTYLTSTTASQNNTKSITAGNAPLIASTAAWSATTEEPYMKVYYKPVLGV